MPELVGFHRNWVRTFIKRYNEQGPYGPEVDWHKNIVAAGGGALVWRGKEYPFDRIEPLDTAAGLATFPAS